MLGWETEVKRLNRELVKAAQDYSAARQSKRTAVADVEKHEDELRKARARLAILEGQERMIQHNIRLKKQEIQRQLDRLGQLISPSERWSLNAVIRNLNRDLDNLRDDLRDKQREITNYTISLN